MSFPYNFCLHRYKNRPPMGFDELGSEADQVIQLSKDPNGEVEYQVKSVYTIMMS